MIRLIFSALILLPGLACAQTLPDPLRNFIWGVSTQDVRHFEESLFIEQNGDHLFYMDEIDLPDAYHEGNPSGDWQTFKALIDYRFADDALEYVRYDFPLDTTDPWVMLDQAMTMQLWLDQVFDQQSKPVFQYRDPTKRDDPGRLGWLIIRGEARMRIAWRTPFTRAELTLEGGNFQGEMHLILRPADAPVIP